jgi:hypothetical protein
MKPKIRLKNVFRHFNKICKHKWWVFYYCCKAGIPWRGFMHDWSKFSPTEFWESVRYYQGNRSPIDACKEDKGVSRAWLHHKGRNTHHYEYHQDNFDKGGQPLPMPYKDAVEMICDYLGAGRAYMGKDFTYQKEYEWWLNKSSKPIAMHEHTRAFIQMVFANLKREEALDLERPYCIFNKRDLANIYHLAEVRLRVRKEFELG